MPNPAQHLGDANPAQEEPLHPQFHVNWGDAFEVQMEQIKQMAKTVQQPPQKSDGSIGSLLKMPTTITPYPEWLSNRILKHLSLGDTLLGIEVEVENIKNPVDMPNMWQMKQDGSLRNNGIEYVTFPTPACYIPALFKELQKALKDYNTPMYSSRTSVHVHMNVQDFTIEQLKSFVLLYLCFEKVLFKYVGGDREKSIFCVPLSHAGYVGTLKSLFYLSDNDRYSLKAITNVWHKYTSLNLKTIISFGTVEFRHMLGTDDVNKFTGWLQLILALKKAALSMTKEKVYASVADLNTTSEYEAFTTSIFKESRWLLTDFLQAAMEDNVTHIKECFEEEAKNTLNFSLFENSSFFKMNGLKIPVLSDREKYISSLSAEACQEELKRLSNLYSKSDEKTKKILEKEYREIEKHYHKLILDF